MTHNRHETELVSSTNVKTIFSFISMKELKIVTNRELLHRTDIFFSKIAYTEKEMKKGDHALIE